MKIKRTLFSAFLLMSILPLLCGAVIKIPELKDIKDHWAEEYIIASAERGILCGYDDGTFRPSSYITRAEFIKMTVNAFLLPKGGDISQISNPSGAFSDILGHWAEDYINAAYAEQIVYGVTNESFIPDRFISRQDAVLILSRVESRSRILIPETKNHNNFLDSEYIRTECRSAVDHFRKAGIIDGKIGNLFDPIGNMTRAEAAKCIISTIVSLETPANSTNQ